MPEQARPENPTDQELSVPALRRAYSQLTIKAVAEDERTISGIATTPTVDRLGDVVEPLGAQFSLPMPLLWQHRHDEPVGHVQFAKATDKGIAFKARIARIEEPGPLKEMVDKAWQAVKAGLVRGVSIGFRSREHSMMDTGGIRFLVWDWYELSLVTIPANQEATISVIKSIDADLMAASGQSANETEPVARASLPGASGKSPVNLKLKERNPMKTIQEQRAALEASRAAKAEQMNAIMAKSIEEGRSTDEAEQEEFDSLQREVEQIDGDLKRFAALEKLNLQKAVPVTPASVATQADADAARGGYVRVSAPNLPPGIRFARVAKCIGMAKGQLPAAAEIAQKVYGDDQGIVNVLKAAVSAGTATDATWAGPLVSPEGAVFQDFVEFLRPMTIVGKFGTNGIPSLRRVPFRVPLGSQTTGGSGYWVGEGQAKPLTRFDFSRTTMEPLKVANIAVVTRELLRDASISAEMLIRDGLAEALRERMDTDFINPAKAAVAGISPASITNGVSAVASSGVDGDAVRADIQNVMQGFIDADNPPTSGVWIMSASTALALSLMTNELGQREDFSRQLSMAGGMFAGMPVIVSEYVPTSGGSPNTRYVFLVNAMDIYFADEGGITIDMSTEASLQMDNAPTMNVGEMGSPTAPVATSVVSMFQTNSVAFLAERTINWSKRRATAVQAIEGVVWGT
jgi:HK97 family phage major capsid protein/HK97 family phage prohead protease